MKNKMDTTVVVVKSLALAIFSPLVVVGLIVGETFINTKKMVVPPRVHPLPPPATTTTLSSTRPQGQQRHQQQQQGQQP
jgi:hypothetical protein